MAVLGNLVKKSDGKNRGISPGMNESQNPINSVNSMAKILLLASGVIGILLAVGVSISAGIHLALEHTMPISKSDTVIVLAGYFVIIELFKYSLVGLAITSLREKKPIVAIFFLCLRYYLYFYLLWIPAFMPHR